MSLQRAYDARGDQLAYLQNRFTTLEHEAQQAEQKIDALSKVLSERIRLEHVLDAPDLQVTRLAPLPPAPGAHALVAVSKASGDAVLRASGLEAPPPGKTYELWWITKQKGPVPAGTFSAEAGNEVIAKVDPPPAGDSRGGDCGYPRTCRWSTKADRSDVSEGRARARIVARATAETCTQSYLT